MSDEEIAARLEQFDRQLASLEKLLHLTLEVLEAHDPVTAAEIRRRMPKR